MSSAGAAPSEVDRVSEDTPLIPKKKNQKSIIRSVFGIGLPIFLFIMGLVVLCLVEGWPVLTSLYVMVQVVTTVGYGDFVVDNDGGKLFMGFYVLGVLCVLAYYLNIFVQVVIRYQSDGIRRYLREVEDRMCGDHKAYKPLNALIAGGLLFFAAFLFGMFYYRFAEHCTCSYGKGAPVGCIADEGYEKCVATGGYNKEWADAFYMSVVTLSTVGFGDYQPRSESGRIIGCIWMILGVGAAANFINVLTRYFFELEAMNSEEDMLKISREEFAKIDRDNSGHLSKGEFLAYMLVKHMGVSEENVDGILKEFASIDKNNTNQVTYEMLVARQKEIEDAAQPRRGEKLDNVL